MPDDHVGIVARDVIWALKAQVSNRPWQRARPEKHTEKLDKERALRLEERKRGASLLLPNELIEACRKVGEEVADENFRGGALLLDRRRVVNVDCTRWSSENVPRSGNG